MSTVLEEKVPRVMSPIVQQYGPIGQSAAEAVSEGLKKVVSFGVGSVGEKGFENIANPTETIFGKLNAINCPIIGSKISEPAAFALAEDHTQPKGIWVQNPELNAFTKNV
ncbi:MAG TPA: hypothetical protein VLH08_10885, partial [Acidobacteriota bacterium]|nr:hypothetical protein [Acidobacteriota bacterium]